MSEKRLVDIAPAAAAAVVWVVNILWLFRIVTGQSAPAAGPAAGESPRELYSSGLVTRALESGTGEEAFHYTGGFDAPFRPRGRARPASRRGSRRKSSFVRTKLRLNGIYFSSTPLAVLRDESGETFIRGVGEKVGGRTVVSVSENRVVIADSLGRYTLEVPER